MSDLRIIKRDPSSEDKEVIIEIDSTSAGQTGDQVFSVEGLVTDHKDKPLANHTVRAYDKGLVVNTQLGPDATTNAEGRYLIYYNNAPLIAKNKQRADLLIHVLDGNDDLITSSAVISGALTRETVDVSTAEEFTGESEFDLFKVQIEPILQELAAEGAGLTIGDITLDAIELISTKLNVAAELVSDYLKSKDLAETVLDNPPAGTPVIDLTDIDIRHEILFGLLRYDLPYQKSELIRTENLLVREALEATAESTIIDLDFGEEEAIDYIIAAMDNDVYDDALVEEEDDQTSPSLIYQLLELVGVTDDTKKKEFVQSYESNIDVEEKTEIEAFWQSLVTDGVLADSAQLDALKFALQLSTITQEHYPLVEALYNDANINNIEDVASLTEAQLSTHVAAHGVPDRPDATTEEITAYVESLLNSAEEAFPSNSLKKDLAEEAPSYDPEFVSFINSATDFDIKETSPNEYFQANASDPSLTEVRKKAVRKKRRLWMLSKGKKKLDVIKWFEENDLDSASKIAKMGRRRFKRKFSEALGGGEEGEKTAKNIHRMAKKRTAAAITTLVNHDPGINGVGTAAFDASPVNEEAVESNNQLQVFYGSGQYCNCTHCRSSQSPAAYLVDLISFIQEAENTDSAVEPWDIFMSRRPDMVKTELSCKNTSTTLPYIDIVNEVLEYALVEKVINGDTGHAYHANWSNFVSRQTTSDTQSLKTEPEYLLREAYDTLSQEKYSWLLPFNLWNEEGTIYLNKLGVDRSDIVRASLTSSNALTETTIDQACVYLGISSELLSILKDNLAYLAYYGGNGTGNLLHLINPNGYNDPAQRTGLLQVTGLTYDELVQYMNTSFVNPNSIGLVFNPATSCKVEDAELAFTADEYKNLHKFARLQQVLGWSVAELDIALSALSATTITDDIIIRLAGFKKISAKYKLDVLEVIAWYTSLSVSNYDEQKSQYDSVFLNPVYNTDPSIIDVFDTGTSVEVLKASGELNTDNAPVIIGAVRIKAPDLINLIQNELHTGDLNKEDLSHIYRVASFTKSLGISVQEYLDLKAITGIQPVSVPGSSSYPDDTLKFIQLTETVYQAGLTIPELNYLLRHKFDTGFPDSTQENIINLLSNLRTELQSGLEKNGLSIDKTEDSLFNLMNLFMNEQQAVLSVEIIKDGAIVDADNIIDNYWSKSISDVNAAKASLTTGGGTITIAQDRIDYVFEIFHNALIDNTLIKDEIIEFFAKKLDIDGGIISVLINDLIANPFNGSESAINMFMGYDFIHATDDIAGNVDYNNHITTLLKMQKASLAIKNLNINLDNLPFLVTQTTATGWYDILNFPLTVVTQVGASEYESLYKFCQALLLEKRLGNDEFSILKLVQKSIEGSDPIDIRDELTIGTGWNPIDVNYLCATLWALPNTAYNNEDWLLKLERIIEIQRSVPVSAEQLVSWNAIDLTYEQAQKIVASTKSNYDLTTWYKVGNEIREGLRTKQRDALSAYLIANTTEFKDTNDLFAHFLLDTEMAPCMMTSRIKLSISTIQTWVQRIRMDLEPGITLPEDNKEEWEWRKNYRVWEAARKVFLYPENWIEPELRDDKTPFFKELEEELLQDEVNEITAERAYLNYLHKLNEVGYLEVAATFHDEQLDVMHVFARTKDAPHTYYYRKLEDKFHWTGWEKLDIDIEGDHLIPVIFNRRPMLFWPVMNDKPEDISEKDVKVTTQNGAITKDVPNKIPETKVEIKMAYSEFNNNKWQPKKLSKKYLEFDGNNPGSFFFKATEASDGLYIESHYTLSGVTNTKHLGSFFLNNCSGELAVKSQKSASMPSTFSVSNAARSFQKLLEKSGSKIFEIVESIKYSKDVVQYVKSEFKTHKQVLLNETPNRFKLTYSINDKEILSEIPFFYEDDNRVFFVSPTDETFTKNLIVDLLPKSITRTAKKTVRKQVPHTEVVPVKRQLPRYIEPSVRPAWSFSAPAEPRSVKTLQREDIYRLPY